MDSRNTFSDRYLPPDYYFPILLDNNQQAMPLTDYDLPSSVLYNGSMVFLPGFYHFNVTDNIDELSLKQQVGISLLKVKLTRESSYYDCYSPLERVCVSS